MKLKTIGIFLGLVVLLALAVFAEDGLRKPKGPPPSGRGGSHESAEMQQLLASFQLTAEQRAKYDAARTVTAHEMQEIHRGKVEGTLPQEQVLKRALASHKAFNAAVKTILSPEQYAQWEPLREADHHKIAQAHKARDAAKQEASAK